MIWRPGFGRGFARKEKKDKKPFDPGRIEPLDLIDVEDSGGQRRNTLHRAMP